MSYLDTKFNALEPNVPYNSKVVSAESYEKFKSDTRTNFLKIRQIFASANISFRSNGKHQVQPWHGSTGKTGKNPPQQDEQI